MLFDLDSISLSTYPPTATSCICRNFHGNQFLLIPPTQLFILFHRLLLLTFCRFHRSHPKSSRGKIFAPLTTLYERFTYTAFQFILQCEFLDNVLKQKGARSALVFCLRLLLLDTHTQCSKWKLVQT